MCVACNGTQISAMLNVYSFFEMPVRMYIYVRKINVCIYV